MWFCDNIQKKIYKNNKTNKIQQLTRSNNASSINERTLEECWSTLQRVSWHLFRCVLYSSTETLSIFLFVINYFFVFVPETYQNFPLPTENKLNEIYIIIKIKKKIITIQWPLIWFERINRHKCMSNYICYCFNFSSICFVLYI